MKAYQLVFGHSSYEEGYFTTPGRIYVHKEDAEAAKAWRESIPFDPYDLHPTEVKIQEVEIEDTFVPWISEEKIESMRKEVEEFWAHEQGKYAQDEDWGGDEYN